MKPVRLDWLGASDIVPAPHVRDVERAIGLATCGDYASATELRLAILNEMVLRGWPSRVPVAVLDSKLSISSVKGRTGLCVQFGNFARTYADLLKLEALKNGNHIDAAIMIVPDAALAKALGSNLARFERLARELEVFRSVLECPILLYGVP